MLDRMPARYSTARPDHWPKSARDQLRDRIKSRMDKLGLNALQVAQASGLSNSIIYDILSDKKKNPSVPSIIGLAEGLKCSIAWLLGQGDPLEDATTKPPPVLVQISIQGRAERGAFRQQRPMNPDNPSPSVAAPPSRQFPEARCFSMVVADDHLSGLATPVTRGMLALFVDLDSAGIGVESGRCYLVHRRLAAAGGVAIETAIWRAQVYRDRVEFSPVSSDAAYNRAHTFGTQLRGQSSQDEAVFVEGLFYAAMVDYDGVNPTAWG